MSVCAKQSTPPHFCSAKFLPNEEQIENPKKFEEFSEKNVYEDKDRLQRK